MRKLLSACLLVAACGGADRNSGNAVSAPAGDAPAAAASPAPAAIAALTGLYEGSRGGPTDQLCMVGKGPDEARFGLVVWGGNLHSCSGSGRAIRRGDRLILTMAGDSPCEVQARISGETIAFPETVPEGCAYYCGARARLAGAAFTRKGATSEDAMKAKDLVGDPLCGDQRPG
jgi:hypothetical protein